MKIWPLLKYLGIGAFLGKVALTGSGPLPGGLIDFEELAKEFKRKKSPLSQETLSRFEKASLAHQKAVESDAQQDWLDAKTKYLNLSNARTKAGKTIDLFEESDVLLNRLEAVFRGTKEDDRANEIVAWRQRRR
jgi:hypothetical protein